MSKNSWHIINQTFLFAKYNSFLGGGKGQYQAEKTVMKMIPVSHKSVVCWPARFIAWWDSYMAASLHRSMTILSKLPVTTGVKQCSLLAPLMLSMLFSAMLIRIVMMSFQSDTVCIQPKKVARQIIGANRHSWWASLFWRHGKECL